jgi:hypothetical protein
MPPKNAEKFIILASKILGILPNLPENKKTGKDVLSLSLRRSSSSRGQEQSDSQFFKGL